MSIWEYQGHVKDKDLVEEGLYLADCLFCKTKLVELPNLVVIDNDDVDDIASYTSKLKRGIALGKRTDASMCPTCGWWKISREVGDLIDEFVEYYGAVATLHDLDLIDLSTPIEEVKQYLVAKYESRYDMHPRLFEETVASVFRGLGYRAKVTAYSGDGGIDIILEGQDSNEIGVQVKRYRNSISVEQIRSLVGALMLERYTKGIFVTTSKFQSGASGVAKRAALRGIQIELIDAEKFFDALKIVQRKNYEKGPDLFAQVIHTSLMLLERIGTPR